MLSADRGVSMIESLVRRRRETFTERFAKAGRDDKILVDYLRNNRTNTSIAAYSTRARPDAPVSTPLAWAELSASRTPDRARQVAERHSLVFGISRIAVDHLVREVLNVARHVQIPRDGWRHKSLERLQLGRRDRWVFESNGVE